MNASISIRINPSHLTILSHLSKLLYDDVTYIVLEYIIQRQNQLIDEQEMASHLSLSTNTVRKSLTTLEKQGILFQSQHTRHRNEDDFKGINSINMNTSSMNNSSLNSTMLSNNSSIMKNKQSTKGYSRQGNRIMKTSYWKLNNTFYNGVKIRFEELEKRLKEKLRRRETMSFKCLKCNTTYSEAEGSLNNLVCVCCVNKPRLVEEGGEDVTELRRMCNEVIAYVKKVFRENQGGGADFEYIGKQGEKGAFGNKKYVEFRNLNEPGIDEMLKPEKKDIFYEVMDYYVYEKSLKFNHG